ncbi:MAG: hypothetical protein H7317_15890 [Pseudorhodobacter sp.]|nr:hypothetical protein [Pseudorhodobacter sp.]
MAIIFSLIAFTLATMVVQGGSAMAMEQMSDTAAMAGMNMGDADAPVCPPELCAQMKACAATAFTVEAAANFTGFAPNFVSACLVQLAPGFHDPVSGYGVRRPPRST